MSKLTFLIRTVNFIYWKQLQPWHLKIDTILKTPKIPKFTILSQPQPLMNPNRNLSKLTILLKSHFFVNFVSKVKISDQKFYEHVNFCRWFSWVTTHPYLTPENTKNTKFSIKSNAQKSLQLFEIRTKFVKIDKSLNHVFKTSKKTLSYSRTYCKIYKIENIGKIGQSSAVLKAKRVIYYGSTRSTLSTPLREKWPPHFHRWFSKSGKKWNYHFWGFLSQKLKKHTFWHFLSILNVKHIGLLIDHLQNCQKHSISVIFAIFTTKTRPKIELPPLEKHDKIRDLWEIPPKVRIPPKSSILVALERHFYQHVKLVFPIHINKFLRRLIRDLTHCLHKMLKFSQIWAQCYIYQP